MGLQVMVFDDNGSRPQKNALAVYPNAEKQTES